MLKQLMRDNLPDDYGILKLQNAILNIAVYMDEFCSKYNIEYRLMGGSALGAKRHSGFIPWDDDLDVFMTPDNYEKFRIEFIAFADKTKYYLQEWGECEGMVTISKVRMNNTTYLEPLLKNMNIHHGIYVDIFILHNCPDNRFKQLWQFFWAKYVITKGLANRGYKRRGGIVGILVKTVTILPQRFLIKFGLKQVYRFRNEKSANYCNFMGKALFKAGIYKKEWFDQFEYVTFEKVHLKVSKHLHNFLSERFGNYMKIPSPDRIKWEQHADTWNVNSSDIWEKQNAKNKYYGDEKKMI